MADTQLFGTLCTDIGNAAIANSVLTGTKVNFSQIVVGDANGTPYVPTSGMTALKHQVWSGAIAEVTQDPQQANRMILHAVLPSSVGGWIMREIGVQDDAGRLIAIGNTPELPKEVVTSGAIMEMDLYIYISVVDARGVNVVIDPTVVIASKADVAKIQKALNDFQAIAATSVKLGDNSALSADGNIISIPAADSTHDGYMTSAQAIQLSNHVADTTVHITAAERSAWNGKTNRYQFDVAVPTSGWTGETAPYTQTVNVSGLTAAMRPIMDLVQSDTVETAQSQLDAYSCINRATTANGSLTLMCYYAKPDADINVHLEVII